MTLTEDLAVVRARLMQVIFLAGAATPGPWTQKNSADIVTGSDTRWKVSVAWGVTADAAFIAAASPDLLLRLAREALGVLDLHPKPLNQRCMHCIALWPCPEVAAVLRERGSHECSRAG